MAVIETKFGIGDVVWHASIATVRKQHPCPDCLGSREWVAKSPAGGEFKVPCPRCTASYQGNQDLNLNYSQWTGSARRLTIGLIRAHAGPDGQHEYMCRETGIGSGSLYRESTLFATEAEALASAEAQAAVNNADAEGWVAKQYSATAKFCDYELKDAVMEAGEDRVRRKLYDIGYLLEDLDNAETMDDVRQRIADWRERREAA